MERSDFLSEFMNRMVEFARNQQYHLVNEEGDCVFCGTPGPRGKCPSEGNET